MRLILIASTMLLAACSCAKQEPAREPPMKSSLADHADKSIANQMDWSNDAIKSGQAKSLPKP